MAYRSNGGEYQSYHDDETTPANEDEIREPMSMRHGMDTYKMECWARKHVQSNITSSDSHVVECPAHNQHMTTSSVRQAT
ncbi:hypothetical protein PILCRDRAFT_504693 [Piloderma croceum F 1598]|uniref:Uncharacterized protein n=1 Tax=Piloderma croceum (strain F 1598) TaxID=765440 RepID=A0A0C3FPU3_PILCF|nr:hypothetical protein PILCRDRAFT_504693 [Piloderma croceum F 1598]